MNSPSGRAILKQWILFLPWGSCVFSWILSVVQDLGHASEVSIGGGHSNFLVKSFSCPAPYWRVLQSLQSSTRKQCKFSSFYMDLWSILHFISFSVQLHYVLQFHCGFISSIVRTAMFLENAGELDVNPLIWMSDFHLLCLHFSTIPIFLSVTITLCIQGIGFKFWSVT